MLRPTFVRFTIAMALASSGCSKPNPSLFTPAQHNTLAAFKSPTMSGTPRSADRLAVDARLQSGPPGNGSPAWYDTADQADFDTMCNYAATTTHLPLVIVTTDATVDRDAVISKPLWNPLVGHATLVVVHARTERGVNGWARAFAAAIGAKGDKAVTVTDRPSFDTAGCHVGKVYQSPLGTVDPVQFVEAVNTGRPPTAKAK